MNKPTFQSVTPEMFAALPAFVQQAVHDTIKGNEARLEGCADDENLDRVQACVDHSLYAEVTGTLDASKGNLNKAISFWIGGRDEILGYIYIGGSGCWMLPDGHMIGFTAIDPAMLSPELDRQTWWVITYDQQRGDQTAGCAIIKINVRLEEEVQAAFPEIG